MRLPQGQLFEHLVRCRNIGDIQNERDADPVMERIPLIDLTIQIELHGLPHFGRQDRPRSSEVPRPG